jgi:hypothetical protein
MFGSTKADTISPKVFVNAKQVAGNQPSQIVITEIVEVHRSGVANIIGLSHVTSRITGSLAI